MSIFVMSLVPSTLIPLVRDLSSLEAWVFFSVRGPVRTTYISAKVPT